MQDYNIKLFKFFGVPEVTKAPSGIKIPFRVKLNYQYSAIQCTCL